MIKSGKGVFGANQRYIKASYTAACWAHLCCSIRDSTYSRVHGCTHVTEDSLSNSEHLIYESFRIYIDSDTSGSCPFQPGATWWFDSLLWFGLVRSLTHSQKTRRVQTHTQISPSDVDLSVSYPTDCTRVRQIYRASPSLFWQFLRYAWQEIRPEQMIKSERKHILFVTDDASTRKNFPTRINMVLTSKNNMPQFSTEKLIIQSYKANISPIIFSPLYIFTSPINSYNNSLCMKCILRPCLKIFPTICDIYHLKVLQWTEEHCCTICFILPADDLSFWKIQFLVQQLLKTCTTCLVILWAICSTNETYYMLFLLSHITA